MSRVSAICFPSGRKCAPAIDFPRIQPGWCGRRGVRMKILQQKKFEDGYLLFKETNQAILIELNDQACRLYDEVLESLPPAVQEFPCELTGKRAIGRSHASRMDSMCESNVQAQTISFS